MDISSRYGSAGKVAELFAGVGGFRLGLEAAGWETVYSNQWEPSTKRQHASEVYVANFGESGHDNSDISKVQRIPVNFDLLVGGFPCQDYSVAKSRSASSGIEGKKGVLWWDILRLVEAHAPKFLFLENVDRLLKSPANQRGRDFAIMLSSLGNKGYVIEWRVVNAADYGFPQRRKRVFIVAYKSPEAALDNVLIESGVLTKAFPVEEFVKGKTGVITGDLISISDSFGVGAKSSAFLAAGAYKDGNFITAEPLPRITENPMTLEDVLLPLADCDSDLIIDDSQIEKWKYLKGAKSEARTHSSGFEWRYTEGAMAFPDPVDRPSRTLLTGEGGSSPSRFKHVVFQDGVYRRLHPVELERLNGFPDNWTKQGKTEITDARRAFFMGNALVVGLIEKVGLELANRMGHK